MSKFVRICLGIMSGLLIMITSMESRGLKNNLSIQDESIAFKCLLNIPMGISPAELKTYLSECQGITMLDVSRHKYITQQIDISSFQGQVLFDIYIQEFIEREDSLTQLSFSFFKGGLYSIKGIKSFDYNTIEEKTNSIVSQYVSLFGKPKYISRTIQFGGDEYKEKSPNWKIGNKSLTLDTYITPESYIFIEVDSISKLVSEITNSNITVEVFTYSGSDPKEKQSISSWAYTDGEGISYSNPNITTYCEGVGNINLKGKASGLTFTITCDDGTVVFEKTGINVKGKSTILKKNQFPNKCESKDYYNYPDNPTYSTHYKITISKLGHPLFEGNIFRDECND